MGKYVSPALRHLVAERSGYRCEYCLIPSSETFLGCHIDHIISEKHCGETEPLNLAYACVFCNRYKGSDIASLSASGQLTRLYNPRIDVWGEHFQWEGARIAPVTEIGEVTAHLLGMNHPDRLLEREILIESGRNPSA